MINQTMIDVLDKFFAEKTIQDIDRNTFLICNLYDKKYKITISLVFLRDWDSLETDSYNSVIIENKGAVFTFPCYWISVPKELAMGYFQYIIDDFYKTSVYKWNGNITNNDNSANCPCNNMCNI